jgi:hypothetical protein
MQALLDPVYTSIYDTRFLTEEQKIHGVLLLLRSMRLSALNLVTKILGDQPEYKSWKLGLFKGKGFEFFFSAMERDKLGMRVMERKLQTDGLTTTVRVMEKACSYFVKSSIRRPVSWLSVLGCTRSRYDMCFINKEIRNSLLEPGYFHECRETWYVPIEGKHLFR